MDKRSVQTGETPKINLEVMGSLSLRGYDESHVEVMCSSQDDLSMDVQDDQVNIVCHRDAKLRVPYGSRVDASRIHGDASLKALEGELSIDRNYGNLSLRSVGRVKVGDINGSLTAKNVNGDMHLNSSQGNVSVRDIRGDFTVEESITGNLVLKDIDGSAKAVVGGNVNVDLDPSPESSYDFQAKGNLTCRLPEDASVKVSISHGANVRIKIPEVEVLERIVTPYEFVLGEGDARLALSASGNITLSSQPPDWNIGEVEVEIGEDYELFAETLNEQISSQIDAQMEMMDEELKLQLDNLSLYLDTAAMSAEQAERIAERVRMASERAHARAQEKIRRAQAKMERKLEATRRRAERKARAAEQAARDRRRKAEPIEWAPSSPKKVPEPVSDEERLMILQLLEQGKINTKEAEQLLSALEGKSP
jgi:hypothetical protein